MRKNLLFLIRAYNDLDHFAPVMWKAASERHRVRYIFSNQWSSSDYRVALIKSLGAKEIRPSLLNWYHWRIRGKISPRWVRRLADGVIGMSLGVVLLVWSRSSRIIVEWGGRSGRGIARYILVPSRIIGLHTFSLPHGYHIWCNEVINTKMIELGKKHQAFDFSERNSFSKYAVQSENIKKFFLNRNLKESNVLVLGSARFSEDWARLNLHLAEEAAADNDFPVDSSLITIFLGNWDYRVNKNECLKMVERVSEIREAVVLVKGHTRGDLIGGLTALERDKSLPEKVIYVSEEVPSNFLIKNSAGIINYGSSIGIEAVLQRKPLCNASYLTENTTIFDKSGVALDAHSIEDVTKFVFSIVNRTLVSTSSEERRSQFLHTHVYGGRKSNAVLQEYLELLCSNPRV